MGEKRIDATLGTSFRRATGASELVQRPRTPHEAAISSDNVEVKGSPVSQEHRLVTLSLICLDISAAGLAVVDPQTSLSLNRHDCKSVIVYTLTERTTGSPVAPTRATTTARKKPETSRISADQLSHGGERSTSRAVGAEPALLVAPAAERVHYRAEIASQDRPSQVTKQAWIRGCERVVIE